MYSIYFNTKNVPYVIKLKSSIDSETLAKCLYILCKILPNKILILLIIFVLLNYLSIRKDLGVLVLSLWVIFYLYFYLSFILL